MQNKIPEEGHFEIFDGDLTGRNLYVHSTLSIACTTHSKLQHVDLLLIAGDCRSPH